MAKNNTVTMISEKVYTLIDEDGNERQVTVTQRKYRAIAILLIVLFGAIGFWVYTYKKNKLKLWIVYPLIIAVAFLGSIGTNIAMIGMGAANFWALIESIYRPTEWYDFYYVDLDE